VSQKCELLLKYEDLTDNLPLALDGISGFLNRDIIKDSIPDRDTIAGQAGQLIDLEVEEQVHSSQFAISQSVTSQFAVTI